LPSGATLARTTRFPTNQQKEYVDLVPNATNQPADRIYPFTKFVAVLLGIVVAFAFVVLYFFPTRTKQLFAWPIAPPMTAMFMSASRL
jgi:hypothetical protein